jgi:hypothetical protein
MPLTTVATPILGYRLPCCKLEIRRIDRRVLLVVHSGDGADRWNLGLWSDDGSINTRKRGSDRQRFGSIDVEELVRPLSIHPTHPLRAFGRPTPDRRRKDQHQMLMRSRVIVYNRDRCRRALVVNRPDAANQAVNPSRRLGAF